MKKVKRGIILIVILFILGVLFLPSRTSKIQGDNSVANIEYVELGGLEQAIMIRAQDKSNPIILFLHGGPGYAQISYARKYQETLEKDFIVVNWDQRGSGKSYHFNIPPESMNKEQFVLDTNELIDYLCKKFDQDKIYLVGHSWGSEFGLQVVRDYPDKIIAFISSGQVVHEQRGELLSYNFTLMNAKKNNNKAALRDLTKIGPPPYKNSVKGKVTQQKWLKKYGGMETIETQQDMILSSIFSKEYSGIDGIRLALGSKFTADAMWESRNSFNAFEEIPKVEVPIYFCVGKYDYTTPFTLIEEYYEFVSTPQKELIWFEKSAHFPHFEEVDKFYELMMRIKSE